jgi:hypothetical protein
MRLVKRKKAIIQSVYSILYFVYIEKFLIQIGVYILELLDKGSSIFYTVYK